MRETIVAIDAKELAKKNIGSLGLILLELFPKLSEYKLILLSDSEIPVRFIPSNAETIIRGTPYTGGSDLFRYQKWMKNQCESQKVNCFFQINHFLLFRIKGAKQIVVVHDLYPLEKIQKSTAISRLLYRASLFLTMVNADTIFTVSDFSKKRLEHFFWKSDKIHVNYNGIGLIEKSFREPVIDGKFFLMLGRVSYWKGTLRVANFFEKYFKDSEYKLIVAGQAQDENDSTELSKITKRVGSIIWLDYVDNETRNWLLQNAELFLYASRYDGFGLPPLEAAMVKTKVLMNDIPVLREVTQNQGNYVDFYSNDEKLYEAISTAVRDTDSSRLEKMYNVARSYTWEVYANRIKAEINAIRKE